MMPSSDETSYQDEKIFKSSSFDEISISRTILPGTMNGGMVEKNSELCLMDNDEASSMSLGRISITLASIWVSYY